MAQTNNQNQEQTAGLNNLGFSAEVYATVPRAPTQDDIDEILNPITTPKKSKWLKRLVIGGAIASSLIMASDLYTHTHNIVSGTNNNTLSRKIAESIFNGAKNVGEKVGNYAVANIEELSGDTWQDSVLVDGNVQKNKDSTVKTQRHEGDLSVRVLTVAGDFVGKTWDYAVAEPTSEAMSFYTGKERPGKNARSKQITPTKPSDIKDTRDKFQWFALFNSDDKKETKTVACPRAQRGGLAGVISRVAAGTTHAIFGDDDKYLVVPAVQEWYMGEVNASNARAQVYVPAQDRRWIAVPDVLHNYASSTKVAKNVNVAYVAPKNVVNANNVQNLPVDDFTKANLGTAAKMIADSNAPTRSDANTNYYEVVVPVDGTNTAGKVTVVDHKKDYKNGGPLDEILVETSFGNYRVNLQ